MLRFLSVVFSCLLTFSAFCQPALNYQVATIVDVKPHESLSNGAAEVASYDVTVKVGDTIYVVLYTPPLNMTAVKYAAGRSLLVLVGKKTITYNDMLGRSFEVPILSQKPARDPKQSRLDQGTVR